MLILLIPCGQMISPLSLCGIREGGPIIKIWFPNSCKCFIFISLTLLQHQGHNLHPREQNRQKTDRLIQSHLKILRLLKLLSFTTNADLENPYVFIFKGIQGTWIGRSKQHQLVKHICFFIVPYLHLWDWRVNARTRQLPCILLTQINPHIAHMFS